MEVYMCGYCTKEVGDILKPVIERTKLKKNVLWEEICEALRNHNYKLTTEEVKVKWKYLRDQYIRERKKLKEYIPSGASGLQQTLKTTSFKYYKIMTFLNDTVERNPTTSSRSSTDDKLDDTDNENTPKVKKARKKADQHCELTKAVLDFIKEPVSQTSPELTGVDGFLIRLVESLKKITIQETMPTRNKYLANGNSNRLRKIIFHSASYAYALRVNLNAALYDKFYINENLSSKIVQLGENEANKTLGILWNANQDNIQYTIMSISENSIASKRVILSIISQIFDPLGLLGPIIITAKILLQKLWQEKISWDEAIPQNLQTIWSQFLVDNEHNSEMIPEERIISNVGAVVNKFELFNNFSCLHKLQRVFAYCLRFINNSRTTDKKQGPLSNFELENSLYTLVRLAQQESFSNDYTKLTENKFVDKKSNLLSLNPILDKNKLMRVGGRIQNSNCSFDKRHPIILPAKHKITYLILRQEHVRLLHCGPTLLLSSIRERFWPISGQSSFDI
ncbi:hypothetical protein NQ318_007757 [Aromia moschata]|uniref:MADF domain-containing protein n=1 Tax=Aromia moschata TaxID=1265417 RepID=A0AAV8Z2C2_9CUCU|nr:hypothetical protein NQ318_007757 [Aromia moschata]